MRTRTVAVVCWVESGFNLLEISGVAQALSFAGSNWNWRPFRLQWASSQGGLVTSSAQVAVDTVSLSQCSMPEMVVVGGGGDPAASDPSAPCAGPTVAALLPWINADLLWVALGNGLMHMLDHGMCTGLTVSARTDQRKRLSARAPTLHFSDEPWTLDRKVLTSSTSDTLPLGLHLVETLLGQSAARAVKVQFNLTQPAVSVVWPSDIRPPKP